jgi:hypothetical protein
MPANIAMEIARAPDGDVQRALAEAYENKLLPGNQILAIRRIILHQLEFGRLLDRQIGRLGPVKDLSGVNASLAIGSCEVRSITDQAAGRDVIAQPIDSRNSMA